MPERRLRHRGDLRLVPVQVDAGERGCPAEGAVARSTIVRDSTSSLFGATMLTPRDTARSFNVTLLLAESAFLRVEGDRAHDAHVRRRAEVHLVRKGRRVSSATRASSR